MLTHFLLKHPNGEDLSINVSVLNYFTVIRSFSYFCGDGHFYSEVIFGLLSSPLRDFTHNPQIISLMLHNVFRFISYVMAKLQTLMQSYYIAASDSLTPGE